MIPYLFLFAYIAVVFASLWKLFQKAGKPAWAGFVPGYNILVWLKISGKPWWWIFLFLVPGVNLLMFIIMNVNIEHRPGRARSQGPCDHDLPAVGEGARRPSSPTHLRGPDPVRNASAACWVSGAMPSSSP
jgi:hypothetical protein